MRRRSATIGNFWVDLTRTITRILLPFSIVFGLFFVSQGMVQNFHSDHAVATVEGGSQTITGGPVASQESIKEFGTNGGGFYNANSAHPFENPSPLTDWVEIFFSFDPLLAHLHVRTHGRGPAPRLGRLRRDVRALGRRGRGRDDL